MLNKQVSRSKNYLKAVIYAKAKYLEVGISQN